MAKSIRSKIKRKHRAEFRRTVGAEAYEKNMEQIQSKLKECIEKQSMNSIERLSKTLGTEEDPSKWTMEVDGAKELPNIEASETTTGAINVEVLKGENKAPVSSRRSRRKKNSYRAKNAERKQKETKEESPETKRRPKYFCQF